MLDRLEVQTEELPYFRGQSYEEHVSTWVEVDRSVQGHYWMLGAIAASLVKKHGEDVMGKFGSDVGSSRRRIQEYAQTYANWEKRERSRILSFHHHTLASRADEPERVIEIAEDEQLSTRELRAFVKTGELPDRDSPKPKEEADDVEKKSDPNAIKQIVRSGVMEYVVEFNDGSRHTVIRSVLLEQGFKKCSCCGGFGVVARHQDQSQED